MDLISEVIANVIGVPLSKATNNCNNNGSNTDTFKTEFDETEKYIQKVESEVKKNLSEFNSKHKNS